MEPRQLLETLRVAERLKDATRHCYTSQGRHESVAEHSWMITLMAFLLRDEFPQADMDKVMRMCLIHDLGECFTGDIPTFNKTQAHEDTEERLLNQWVQTLPQAAEMSALYEEMAQRQTLEAKIYKALDGLEAVIQHNLSDLGTWIPKEHELNLTYADEKVAFSPVLTALREEIRQDTRQKLTQDKEEAIHQEMFSRAKALIEKRYPTGWGGAGVVRTANGRYYTSVAPDTANASVELCIETGAMLEAHKANERVTHCLCLVRDDEHSPFRVLSPCGVCQERLRYWGTEVQVAVTAPDDTLRFVPLGDMQPFHWTNAYPADELEHWEEPKA